jgi:hypothetical protein
MKELINYFFSPFVRPKLRFYFGKSKIGLPYFLPRITVKDPEKPGYEKFVEKKIGFDFCRLGWKTKWNETDFRFEWPPILSFVFFGYQIAVIFEQEHPDHYWESWLYYHHITDNKKSRRQRVEECVEKFPQMGFPFKGGSALNREEDKTDYYQLILKKKWRPLTKNDKRDKKINSILK